MGAPIDDQRCVQQRIDSEDRRRELVADARREIVENNYAVDGIKVEGLLKSQSLVPVNVGSILVPSDFILIRNFLECFLFTMLSTIHREHTSRSCG